MKTFFKYIILFLVLAGGIFLVKNNIGNLMSTSEFLAVSHIQNDFKAIETDEITSLIQKKVETEYPGAGIAEAFIDPSGNFKLILVIDQSVKIVYIDAQGHWYIPEQKS